MQNMHKIAKKDLTISFGCASVYVFAGNWMEYMIQEG